MDAYHQILAKLYEVTEGKESQPVYFKELVKSLGFYSSYADTFERMSREGWIAEDEKPDYVRITLWGIKELQNPTSTTPDIRERSKQADAYQAISEAKELSLLLEVFTGDMSAENMAAVERKISDINALLEQIKSKPD